MEELLSAKILLDSIEKNEHHLYTDLWNDKSKFTVNILKNKYIWNAINIKKQLVNLYRKRFSKLQEYKLKLNNFNYSL